MHLTPSKNNFSEIKNLSQCQNCPTVAPFSHDYNANQPNYDKFSLYFPSKQRIHLDRQNTNEKEKHSVASNDVMNS